AKREQRRAESGFPSPIRRFYHRARERRQRIRELVVTVQAGNFFDQIDFAFYIQTPRRNAHREFWLSSRFRNQFETETFENCNNLVRLEFAAENAVDLRDAQDNRRLIDLACDGVDHPTAEFATAG